MGGRGSGGLRTGAGRKSKEAHVLALHGGRDRLGVTNDAQQPASVPNEPVDAPEDMPVDQRAVWDELAPHATAASTLTPRTALAFRQLCGRIVLLHKMEARLELDGLMTTKVSLQMDQAGGGLQNVEPKAHDLLTKCMTMMQRVDQGMLRFMLSPMGKEIVQPVKDVDPFAEFETKAESVQ